MKVLLLYVGRFGVLKQILCIEWACLGGVCSSEEKCIHPGSENIYLMFSV